MAAAIHLVSSDDHNKLCEELEKQEIDAPGGVPNGEIYLKLLALYLLKNDLCNAKYLWKRTPQSIKMATPELGLVWSVGQKLWQRDFAGIYQALNKEWSESVAQIMQALLDSTRNRALQLVSQAYSSIDMEEFSGFVGLPKEQAIQIIEGKGWSVDQNSGMVLPIKCVPSHIQSTASEEQLTKLTEFVAFLEN